MTKGPHHVEFEEDLVEANVSIWQEALFAADILLLHASPAYYGLGVRHGDGSAVIVIPGFLGTDAYLSQFRTWLGRIGYRPYFSGIGINAECPNLLIQQKLNLCMERALKETGRKVHIIGHSLGGIIARSIAAQRPDDVASVITLASPFRGTVAHRTVLRAAEAVRGHILRDHGSQVLPTCYTGRCTCNFLDSIRRNVPSSVYQTAIYTRNDGIVDWRYCLTEIDGCDFEVPGTHIGLSFNASAYTIIANRLAEARNTKKLTRLSRSIPSASSRLVAQTLLRIHLPSRAIPVLGKIMQPVTYVIHEGASPRRHYNVRTVGRDLQRLR